MPNDFFVDSKKLSPAALEKKHRLESDPSCRRDIDDYYEGMERIDSDVAELVLDAVKDYDPHSYGPRDVVAALEGDRCGVDHHTGCSESLQEDHDPGLSGEKSLCQLQ